MIALNIEIKQSTDDFTNSSPILKITNFTKLEANSSEGFGLLVSSSTVITNDSYGAYIFYDQNLFINSKLKRKILLPIEACYLATGDVVKFNIAEKKARTVYRERANSNSFLVTENCNSFCLMCSQPPKKRDDSFLLTEIREILPFLPKHCSEIGFTGGEPFLRGDSFLEILKEVKTLLPNTSVHILSNGRLFKDIQLARKLASIDLSDLMIGIPIYSDLSYVHDFIVQSPNAFTETIKGILNLKKVGLKVEIRFVIHNENHNNIISFSEFVLNFLPFVDHVAFMGLEHMGFAKHNLEKLSIDPIDYMDSLKFAVLKIASKGIRTSIYNHQLCIVPFELYPYYRKSISDWKNEFFDECNKCSKTDHCGGFFSSTMIKSRALKAL